MHRVRPCEHVAYAAILMSASLCGIYINKPERQRARDRTELNKITSEMNNSAPNVGAQEAGRESNNNSKKEFIYESEKPSSHPNYINPVYYLVRRSRHQHHRFSIKIHSLCFSFFFSFCRSSVGYASIY